MTSKAEGRRNLRNTPIVRHDPTSQENMSLPQAGRFQSHEPELSQSSQDTENAQVKRALREAKERANGKKARMKAAR